MPSSDRRVPFRARVRPADRAPAQDPADLGTAFGLEMSLDQDVVDPPRPAGDGRPATGAGMPGWWSRLVRRSGR